MQAPSRGVWHLAPIVHNPAWPRQTGAQRWGVLAMDGIDRRILEALQQDGRLANLELADRVGLSASPCLRRVKLLERAGVIEGYAARLNRQALGLGLMVFVAVNIERHTDREARAFRQAVAALPEVIACYITSGEHDFLLQVVVEDLDAYRRFTLDTLIKIDGVKDIRSSFAIDVVKENGALPLGHLR
jgi:Lrp/AsnC family transcriptional regulator, leucine-responsive regulatory protein